MRICSACNEETDDYPKRGGKCNPCLRAVSKKWQKDNPDERRAIRNRWRKNHPEEMKVRNKRWRTNKKMNDWAGYLLTLSKTNARTKELEHTITKEDIERMFEQQRGRCYYTDVEMLFDPRPKFPWFPSIDRVDSTKGYTRDNVVLCVWWINRAKSDLDVTVFFALFDHAALSRFGKLGTNSPVEQRNHLAVFRD